MMRFSKLDIAMTDCQRREVYNTTQPVKPAKTRADRITWMKNPKVMKAHQYQMRHLTTPDYPSYKVGRGIVIPGGGAYLVSAMVTVRMIRESGCQLPIELWYLGRNDECPEVWRKEFESFNVVCVDADQVALRHPCRILNGFEVKDFAVMHSAFSEVLMLDADCYPIANPEYILDHETYKGSGAVFYPDQPETNKWTNWNFFKVEPFPPNCGWETGVYFIDTRRHWDLMQLVRWLNDHSEWCYGAGSAGDHGDKGPWRVSFAAHGRIPTFFTCDAKWVKQAFIHVGANREPLFVHRCRDKFRLPGTEITTTKQNTKRNMMISELSGEVVAHQQFKKVCDFVASIKGA